MRDFLEQAEDAAEAWADEHVRGDRFLCDCGKWARLDEGMTLSPNPYAAPVCAECFEAEVKRRER